MIVCVFVCHDADDDNHQVTDISLCTCRGFIQDFARQALFFFRFLLFCFFVVEIHCKQVEWDPSCEALDRSHWIDDRERTGC